MGCYVIITKYPYFNFFELRLSKIKFYTALPNIICATIGQKQIYLK